MGCGRSIAGYISNLNETGDREGMTAKSRKSSSSPLMAPGRI